MEKMQCLMLGLIIQFLYLTNVCAANENKSALVQLTKLITMNQQTVQTYEGYRFNVSWIGGKPTIDIIQQQVNLVQKTVGMKSIIQVHSKDSVSDQNKTIQELADLKTFKPAKYVQVDGGRYDDDNDQISEFDVYDDHGQIRASEWRKNENGFGIESVFFTEDGKQVSLFYYDKLRVNQPFSPLYSGKTFMITLEHATDKFGPCDSNDPQSVIKFCKALLEMALSRSQEQTKH